MWASTKNRKIQDVGVQGAGDQDLDVEVRWIFHPRLSHLSKFLFEWRGIEQCLSLWVGCIPHSLPPQPPIQKSKKVLKLYLHPIWVSKHSKSRQTSIPINKNCFNLTPNLQTQVSFRIYREAETSPAWCWWYSTDIPEHAWTIMDPSWTYHVNVIEILIKNFMIFMQQFQYTRQEESENSPKFRECNTTPSWFLSWLVELLK